MFKLLLSNKRLIPSFCTPLSQVEPTASALNTNDMFVLKSPESQWLWKGKGANPEERAAAEYVATLLGAPTTEVEETNEPGEH